MQILAYSYMLSMSYHYSISMKALIYSKEFCPYCSRAKQKLEELGIDYTEIDVTDDEAKRNEMMEITGQYTVPQIFLHIGGCDDLFTAHEEGKLDSFLQQ